MKLDDIAFWLNILSFIVGLGITIAMARWPSISKRLRHGAKTESKVSYATQKPQECVLVGPKWAGIEGILCQ